MILAVRAELFQPGLQLMKPEFFNQLIGVHALVMIFAALMPAATGFANWMIPLMIGAPGHGPAAPEQLGFLAVAARRDPAHPALYRSPLFGVGDGAIAYRLDLLRAALGAGRHGCRLRHPRRAYPGHLVDHGLDQHHRHHLQHARARHDDDEAAAVRLGLADHRLPADRLRCRCSPAR
jgi:hypothetical protein